MEPDVLPSLTADLLPRRVYLIRPILTAKACFLLTRRLATGKTPSNTVQKLVLFFLPVNQPHSHIHHVVVQDSRFGTLDVCRRESKCLQNAVRRECGFASRF